MALRTGTVRLLLEGFTFQGECPLLEVRKKHPGNYALYTLADADGSNIDAKVSDTTQTVNTGDSVQLINWDVVRCQDATMLHVQSWRKMPGQEDLLRAPTPLRQPQSFGLEGDASRMPGQFADNPYSRRFGQDPFYVSASQDPDRGARAEYRNPAQDEPQATHREPHQQLGGFGGTAASTGDLRPQPGGFGGPAPSTYGAQNAPAPQTAQTRSLSETLSGHYQGSPQRAQRGNAMQSAFGEPGLSTAQPAAQHMHPNGYQQFPQTSAPQTYPRTLWTVPPDAPQGAYQGSPQRAQHAPQVLPQGSPQRMPQATPQGLPQGTPQGIPQSHHQGSLQNPAYGAPQGSCAGAAQSMHAGLQTAQQSGFENSPPRGTHAHGAGAVAQSQMRSTGLFTINGLSSYRGVNWKLLARVTKKSLKRKFRKPEREGKLFHIDLADKEGTETRATFWNSAVDKYYDLVQEGQTYVFSGGRVQKGNVRFCPFAVELSFDEKAGITEETDTGDIPKMVVNPLESLACLESQEEKCLVDVVAVIAEVDQPLEFTRKDNSMSKRQNITLLDDSGTSCNLTFWDDFCKSDWTVGEVILVKHAIVSTFGGKSLSSRASSTFIQGPEAFEIHPRAAQLARWYQEQGAAALPNARPLTEARRPTVLQTIDEVKDEARGLEAPGADLPLEGSIPGESGRQLQKYHTISPVTVTYIPHEKPPFYMACAEEVPDEKKEGQKRTCNKKLEPADGCWICASGHQCQEPAVRWICWFSVADHTGTMQLSSFDDVGQNIMGCKAEEAGQRWERREFENVQHELENIFKNACHKRWRIRVRSKKEFWNDEEKLKYTAIEVTPLNLVQDGRMKYQEVMQSLAALEQR